jgi:hypothetical protein
LARRSAPSSQVVGAALPVFAQLVSAAIIPLAGAFSTLAPQLTPIIQLLGGALTQAFQTLAPVIEQLVPIVGQALGAAFSSCRRSCLRSPRSSADPPGGHAAGVRVHGCAGPDPARPGATRSVTSSPRSSR